ncbi:unnamed protein product [Peronospora belbahrii]|uniref:C2H2-type domain-containing protein n=1 Tax=Peronospora belbahrii TaxID=622444 RepID=A0ABN8CR56_9STRA|nr:unnamed protein product [Peronospora belbahrii]
MKTPRHTYMPSESDIPEPSAADLADGIVGPMEMPMHAPIPLLRLQTRQFRKKKARMAGFRHLFKHEGSKPYVSIAIRRLKKLERLRSSHGLPVVSFREKAQRLRDSMDEEFHVMQNQSSICLCFSCQHIRRWSSTLQPYRCTNTNCRITFDSFTDLYDHQLDVHGGLDPRANRIVNELYHQQQGMLALPPSTVYAGQQFLTPSRPPTPWKSMDELDEEARTLMERLREKSQALFVRPFNIFKTAYELVKRNGWEEMKRQYHIAMEHYYAAMKYLASSRGFHDGCPSVERGRNWLTSTDREDARLLYPFSLGDKMDIEPEFVLIDTKCDEEMYIELSSDEDDGDISVDDGRSSEQKRANTDEDVKMNMFEGECSLKAAHERKVFGVDNDVDLKFCEESGNDPDAQPSGNDEKVELKFSKRSDSDSESDSENDEDKTTLSSSEDVSKVQSISDGDSDIAVKIAKDKASSYYFSDTDSSTESEDDKTDHRVQLSSLDSNSDSDSDDVAFKIKDEAGSNYVCKQS